MARRNRLVSDATQSMDSIHFCCRFFSAPSSSITCFIINHSIERERCDLLLVVFVVHRIDFMDFGWALTPSNIAFFFSTKTNSLTVSIARFIHIVGPTVAAGHRHKSIVDDAIHSE